MPPLKNAKREKYVQNLIKGMTQRPAYKDAFKATYKDEVIDRRASELFNTSEVQGRYKELMEKMEKHTIMSALERKEWLTKVVNGEIKEQMTIYEDGNPFTREVESNLNTKIKALDTLNKMSGDYIQDIRLSGDKNNPIYTQTSVIDSVAKQMSEISEDDIDVRTNT